MEILPPNITCLDLSIAVPGFSSSPSSDAEKEGGAAMKLLDINEAPSRSGEECIEEEEDEENPVGYGPAPRKKLRLTKEQSRRLEENFLQNATLNPREKEILAMELRLKPRQVEVWFQNRRARSKTKQTEIECEYLKRWFGALTEQNRRLQKEMEELRSTNPPPPLAFQPPPVSALIMCPRCERVTATTLRDKSPTATTTTTTFSSEGKARFLQRRRRPSAVSDE